MKRSSLRDIGEFGLIQRIAHKAKRRDASVLVGIGDDAAVITSPLSPLIKGEMGGVVPLLVTADSLVEDVHFRRNSPPDALGWKALAVSISDIAAMGGVPEHYLLSISVPEGISVEYLDLFVKGMADAAKKYKLSLIGGDTTSSPDKLYISVTVLGRGSERVLLRSGARPGDKIFVSGTLGDSALGLKILEKETENKKVERTGRFTDSPIRRFLIDRHLRPVPRVKEGVELAKSGMVTSMMDISDGLLGDLGHICEQSRVGARIWLDRLPLSRGFMGLSGGYGGIELVLNGGEDYELLFTVGEKDDIFSKCRSTYRCIGEILREKDIEVIDKDGCPYTTKKRGYEHFRE